MDSRRGDKVNWLYNLAIMKRKGDVTAVAWTFFIFMCLNKERQLFVYEAGNNFEIRST